VERKFANESPDSQLEQLHLTDENDLADADTAIKRAGAEEAQLSTYFVPERLTTGFENVCGIFPMENVCAGLVI